MLVLVDSNDRLRITTSSAADIDVVASMTEILTSSLAVTTVLKQLTTINSATTTTICTEPDGTHQRNIKQITIRNRHASLSNDITVLFQDNATNYEICKFTLRAGDTLQYQEGVGWYLLTNEFKLDVKLRVASDVVNATTSFADITGLTYPVESGKHYGFEANIITANNASTTGTRLAINGPSMTGMMIADINVYTPGATSGVFAAGAATAVDTAMEATTTGSTSNRLSHVAGWFNPSADGTFAMRVASEVAVAAGVTVRAGSWCRLFELDN